MARIFSRYFNCDEIKFLNEKNLQSVQNDRLSFYFFLSIFSLSLFYYFTPVWNHRFHYDFQSLKSWREYREKLWRYKNKKWSHEEMGGKFLEEVEEKHSREVWSSIWKSVLCMSPLLTVHAYWAIPRHECRHKLPERDALHRFHVLPAPIELVHREPTQLLGYRSLVISKEISPRTMRARPRKLLPFFLSSSPLLKSCTCNNKFTNTVYKIKWNKNWMKRGVFENTKNVKDCLREGNGIT